VTAVDQADAAYCIIINLAQETCQVVMHNASSQDVKELGFEEEQLEQELYSRTATASTMVRTALHTVHQLWSELEFPPDSVCIKSERFTCLIPYDTLPVLLYRVQCIGVLEDMLVEIYTKVWVFKHLNACSQAPDAPSMAQLMQALKYVHRCASTTADDGQRCY